MLAVNNYVLRWSARKLNSPHSDSATKLLVGRLLNTLVLPIAIAIYIDQGCYQGYKHFWKVL